MRTHTMAEVFAGLMVIIVFSGLLYVGLAKRTSAAETTPVTCYKDGSRIGTVTVFGWRGAASTCNTVLYDCRGSCIGCFRDSDYINDVCIDLRGNVFLR